MSGGDAPARRVLRRAEVEARIGVSTSTLYRGLASGIFPAPIKLGENAVGWLESEVDDWIATRPRVRVEAATDVDGDGEAKGDTPPERHVPLAIVVNDLQSHLLRHASHYERLGVPLGQISEAQLRALVARLVAAFGRRGAVVALMRAAADLLSDDRSVP